MVLLSRRDAIRKGKKRYFDGKPCKAGHVAPKFTRNKTCVKCWLNIRNETSSSR